MPPIKKCFIHIWFDDPKDIELKLTFVKKCVEKKQHVKLVFCGAEEFEWFGNLGIENLNSKYLDTHLILGYVENKKLDQDTQNYKIHVWQDSWIYFTASQINASSLKDAESVDKLFMCLNGKYHLHRCRLIDELNKLSLLDNSYFSWRFEDSGTREDYEFRYWKEKVVTLPSEIGKSEIIQSLIPAEFKKVVFHVITESTVEKNFLDISEKTWHCILLGEPFIVLGTPGLHKTLKEWGFKLYEEIFSYDFDSEPRWENRMYSIIAQVNKLNQQYNKNDYNKLKQSLKEKAKFNQQRAFSIIKEKEMISDIVREFKYYKDTIMRAEENIKHITECTQ